MKYKVNKGRMYNDILKILGKEFVKNNRNKLKLNVKNKKYEIKEYIQSNDLKKSELKVKILLSKDISKLSCMFKNCEALLEFSIIDDIENIENKEINYDYDFDIDNIENNKEAEDNKNNFDKNKEKMFEVLNDNMNFECSSISKIEESSDQSRNSELQINNLKIKEINNKELNYKCESSSSASQYQYNWNSNNVIDMSFMFYNCESLKFLPDLSNLNPGNVTKMSNIFANCGKLLSIPDISKWNTENDTDMSLMFNYCRKLKSLPDISKWNTCNVTNMIDMFDNCHSLLSLPDISN